MVHLAAVAKAATAILRMKGPGMQIAFKEELKTSRKERARKV
jgi:hypothetical protein